MEENNRKEKHKWKKSPAGMVKVNWNAVSDKLEK